MARKGVTATAPLAAKAAMAAATSPAAVSASATSTGDVVLEWDASTVTTMTQLRAAVAACLLQISGTSLLTP